MLNQANKHPVYSIHLAPLFILIFVFATSSKADPTLPLPQIPFCGDQDDNTLQASCDEFSPRADVEIYQVPGNEPVTLTFDSIFKGGIFPITLEAYIVDDSTGAVNGVLPGTTAYDMAVGPLATEIFPAGHQASTPDRSIVFQGGDLIAFRIFQGSQYFYSITEANLDGVDHFVGFQSNELTQFGFEDIVGGGDLDYDDIVFTINPPLPVANTGTACQISGHGWALNASVSEDDGLVVSDVRYGPRLLAREMSMPYFNLKWKYSDPVTANFDERLEVGFGVPNQGGWNQGLFIGTGIRCIDTGSELSISESFFLGREEAFIKVTMNYRFLAAVDGDACEPTGGLPCARFFPQVSYEFTSLADGAELISFEEVQRFDFDADGLQENDINIFQNNSRKRVIFDLETMAQAEQYLEKPVMKSEALVVGNAYDNAPIIFDGFKEWDNMHSTSRTTISQPGINLFNLKPGCAECVHIHWRWRTPTNGGCSALTGGFFSQCWTDGDVIQPDGSDQQILVGVSRFRQEEKDPEDYNLITRDGESLIGANPVFWYASESRKNADTFWYYDADRQHGGYGAAFFAPAETVNIGEATLPIVPPIVSVVAQNGSYNEAGEYELPVTYAINEATCGALGYGAVTDGKNGNDGFLLGPFYLNISSTATLLNPDYSWSAVPVGTPYVRLTDTISSGRVIEKMEISKKCDAQEYSTMLVFDSEPLFTQFSLVRAPAKFEIGSPSRYPASFVENN